MMRTDETEGTWHTEHIVVLPKPLITQTAASSVQNTAGELIPAKQERQVFRG